MVNDINTLVSVINSLRVKGLSRYAAELDRFLCKYAQEMGAGGADPLAALEAADPMGAPTEEPAGAPQMSPTGEPAQVPTLPEVGPESASPSASNKAQRTLFHQFEKWHGVLDRELPKFDYLGQENVDAIRSSLANVHKAFQAAIQNKPAQYEADAIERWNAYINELVQKMHRSQKAKVDKTKAIVDAGMMYDTTKRLYERIQRVGGDDPSMAGVMQEFASLMRVFANVIKQTSEQIAKTDLTEVR